jgi:hypothetical protein
MTLRTEARNKPCLVRLPCCDGGGETTVLAHYRLAGTCGTGIKPPDELGAWCCARCHAVVDGREKLPIRGLSQELMTRDEIKLAFAEGVMRTIYERARK